MLLAQSDPSAGLLAIGVLIYFAVIIVMVAVVMFPIYMIVKKAGYNGWLALLNLVPLVNIVMLYIFAFADWPALRGAAPLGFGTPPPPFPPFPTVNPPPPSSTYPSTTYPQATSTPPPAWPPPSEPPAPPASGTPPTTPWS